MTDKDFDPYAELVRERSPLLFCDVCMYYPIEPVHGHFFCPACRNVTKCCEGMPLEMASGGAVVANGMAADAAANGAAA